MPTDETKVRVVIGLIEPDLTIDDTASEMRCSRAHVHRLVRNGELDTYGIGGRGRRITRQSLDAFKRRNGLRPLAGTTS